MAAGLANGDDPVADRAMNAIQADFNSCRRLTAAAAPCARTITLLVLPIE